MKDRTSSLLAIRPNIENIDRYIDSKEIESFQNKVLRPILKFQNDLLLHIFNDYINRFKGEFFKLSSKQRLSYIHDSLSKDQRLRSVIIGTVVGLFSIEDFSFYRLNKSSLNKRIIAMTIQRIQTKSEIFLTQL
ncbi:MAG: glyoxalase [Flavobacteriales bacterium]|nr:glyoxalase [Flavobacteriales bacterium]|tara:strand:- start:6969 stop:7370 length:402 start_codon:yes stop_codon:yes gene_type:complete